MKTVFRMGLCTALAVLATAMGSAAVAAGHQYEVLFSFDPANGGPAQPRGPLVQGPGGEFFGVTYKGGHSGFGTLFKISNQGELTVLHEFSGPDGAFPTGLSLAKDGFFYGSTHSATSENAFGTIFRLTPEGEFRVLHQFSNKSQGKLPDSPPIQARDGHLYGVTGFGGFRQCGVIYRLTLPEWVYSVQARFGEGGKGCKPYASLVEGKNGALYGTTLTRGEEAMGTVYRFTPGFRQLTLLHAFTGEAGVGSRTPLLAGRDGNFYGTSVMGGAQDSGVAYRITPKGEYTVLHDFSAGAEGGGGPVTGLTQGLDGAVFGGTYYGGANGLGTLYSVSPRSLAVTVAHDFGAPPDGWYPNDLTSGLDGAIYGTSYRGGAYDQGTVFRLVP